jgi:hypothetical protein
MWAVLRHARVKLLKLGTKHRLREWPGSDSIDSTLGRRLRRPFVVSSERHHRREVRECTCP